MRNVIWLGHCSPIIIGPLGKPLVEKRYEHIQNNSPNIVYFTFYVAFRTSTEHHSLSGLRTHKLTHSYLFFLFIAKKLGNRNIMNPMHAMVEPMPKLLPTDLRSRAIYNSTSSLLLCLPAEIRNQIYHYTLGGQRIEFGTETIKNCQIKHSTSTVLIASGTS
jgi:hypothetical protein